ncbi:MAG: hypothetical protein J6D46_09405 [Lachnospiraceae bacterium]|nr:hypothetical protein [Lachnospiraceae bacterium]
MKVKEMKKLTSWILAVLLAASMTACGGSGQGAAETGTSPETVKTSAETEKTSAEAEAVNTETTPAADSKEAPAETTPREGELEEAVQEVISETEQYTMEDLVGEYKGFAAGYLGYTYSLEEAGGSSNMTLLADGTGKLDFDGEETSLTEWKIEGNVLTVVDAEGYPANGTVTHGVITLDFLGDGSSVAHYAKEGTDTSWMEIMTMDEIRELLEKGPGSKTYEVYSAVDVSEGAHLAYELHTDYYDANLTYEVNAKDGIYASSRTTQALGVESTTITFYTDGKVYNLFPADMTGQMVTETTLLENNLLGMDNLYRTLSSFCRSTGYTKETREHEGVSYDVEVYPEGKYNAETAFYYDTEGKLVYVDVKAYTTEAGTEIPASFYTVHAMDAEVDASALDMSAYKVEGT